LHRGTPGHMRLPHRLQGQKSRWGGGILWRPPSRTACLYYVHLRLQLPHSIEHASIEYYVLYDGTAQIAFYLLYYILMLFLCFMANYMMIDDPVVINHRFYPRRHSPPTHGTSAIGKCILQWSLHYKLPQFVH